MIVEDRRGGWGSLQVVPSLVGSMEHLWIEACSAYLELAQQLDGGLRAVLLACWHVDVIHKEDQLLVDRCAIPVWLGGQRRPRHVFVCLFLQALVE